MRCFRVGTVVVSWPSAFITWGQTPSVWWTISFTSWLFMDGCQTSASWRDCSSLGWFRPYLKACMHECQISGGWSECSGLKLQPLKAYMHKTARGTAQVETQRGKTPLHTRRIVLQRIVLSLLGGSGGFFANSLDFCPASLKSLCCFYFRCVLSSQWKAVTINSRSLQCPL